MMTERSSHGLALRLGVAARLSELRLARWAPPSQDCPRSALFTLGHPIAWIDRIPGPKPYKAITYIRGSLVESSHQTEVESLHEAELRCRESGGYAIGRPGVKLPEELPGGTLSEELRLGLAWELPKLKVAVRALNMRAPGVCCMVDVATGRVILSYCFHAAGCTVSIPGEPPVTQPVAGVAGENAMRNDITDVVVSSGWVVVS